MTSPKEQLSILVHLAMVDKYIADAEIKLVHHLGALHGMSREDIEGIVESPSPIPEEFDDYDEVEKFEYLFSIVQLMKVDGKVFQSEIAFCEKIAMKLGYLPGVITDLSAYVYSDPTVITDKKFLKGVSQKYLVKKK